MSIALRRKRKLGDAFPVGTLMFCLLKQLWDNVAQESLRWRRNQVKSCKWTSLHWSSLHFHHHHHHNMHYCTCQRLLLEYWQCHCTANVTVSLHFEVHHSTHNAHIIVSVHKVFFLHRHCRPICNIFRSISRWPMTLWYAFYAFSLTLCSVPMLQ